MENYIFKSERLGFRNWTEKDTPKMVIINSDSKVMGFFPSLQNKEQTEQFIDRMKSQFLKNGFVDAFREFNTEPHNYSWWSYRANARNNNKGWRIDYCMVSEPLKDTLKRAFILPEAKHSDHCPIGVEIT